MTCLIAYHDGDETDERQRGWQTRLAAYLPGCQIVPPVQQVVAATKLYLRCSFFWRFFAQLF